MKESFKYRFEINKAPKAKAYHSSKRDPSLSPPLPTTSSVDTRSECTRYFLFLVA